MNDQDKIAKFYVSLKVLLVNEKKEYLILKSANPNVFQKMYDLPGGRINKDEINLDFHKLVDREIKEEVGQNIKYKIRKDPVSVSKYEFPNKKSPVTFILFEAKYLGGEIKISDEHTAYLWKKITKNSNLKIRGK